MTSLAQRAYGAARTRALKSRLLGPEDADRLRAAKGAKAQAAALHAVGLAVDDARGAFRALFARLVEADARLCKSVPDASAAILELLRLHEVENLKLGWRAKAQGVPEEKWLSLWRPLGRMQALPLEAFREWSTLREVAQALADTPYGAAAAAALASHGDDPAGAEMAFDRQASERLLAEARKLPEDEREARALLFDLVRERDLDALLRGTTTYGLSPELAVGLVALLRDELGPEAVRELATPGEAPLLARLPRSLARRLPPVADLAGLRLALRRARLKACRRAFAGSLFRLAPAIAAALFYDEQVRAVTALVEAQGDPAMDAAAALALAASAMEA